ncbi:FMN-binding negative transcriptional regulator [Tsukamurella paurometabola]|uniref:FMN-binding negative transcriptional regulator n=1 Tax=Tsukamurella paurometabola (strain ATCC 8368 / DSM 20162 / CCUG 35730 / CIP 100753 / JCM 10117 / KCTC 9821 / NBRC 16120 / NCIMB 702349 / NCTC 13040) TaxID=521096 RepID=D5UPW9_TSUPD|nr:FMN-binding negative transcriptional regulator [Tsukamurella paurometabola]ADG76737.1 FMN-binding negative transcriptional regulator [Tsukamurella paurometabola DSM 20162]SUP41416.1 Protease synthase and sporulation protein PAI 2 [Tsukamurella paurometabola]
MYVAAPDRSDDERARAMVAAAGIGTVFSASGGLHASTLPLLWEGDTVIAHLATANRHWRGLDGAEVLIVVTGPDAYVSPGWYPSKAAHGRAVPTWNYSEVQLRGRASIHEDAAACRAIVARLTARHERNRPEPWGLDDAPPAYIEQQLKAIVGLTVEVTAVAAKQKWSRGRSAEDIAGVQTALDSADPRAGAEMRRARGL